MNLSLLPLSLAKIMQSKTYTAFVLQHKEKQFAIYAEPHVGKYIQMNLAGQTVARPRTFDLMNTILSSLDVEITQIVISDVDETLFMAKLFLKQHLDGRIHYLEIDARPSDCLSLAIENNVPIFCMPDVLEKVVFL